MTASAAYSLLLRGMARKLVRERQIGDKVAALFDGESARFTATMADANREIERLRAELADLRRTQGLAS